MQSSKEVTQEIPLNHLYIVFSFDCFNDHLKYVPKVKTDPNLMLLDSGANTKVKSVNA